MQVIETLAEGLKRELKVVIPAKDMEARLNERLEDAKGGAVWLQISNKSMLMNQKLGQRLADECQGSEQVVVAEAIRKNPPISLLERLPDSK